ALGTGVRSEETAMDKYQQSQKNKLFKPDHSSGAYTIQHIGGPAKCPSCGAFYQAGHWVWQADAALETKEIVCPACRRIADGVPAGTLRLSGEFLRGHQAEILNLIHNTEAAEKANHALERLLAINESDGGLEVNTTGMHLANRIGHALCAAYDGHAEYHYDGDDHVGIYWRRD